MKKDELDKILKKHMMWLNHEPGGERADLRSADLRSANLRSADLSYADLRSADLRYANLSYADLRSANLRSAVLSYADLRSAKDGAVCRMDFGGWSICIRSKQTSIGCETHDNELWLKSTARSKTIKAMDDNAAEWWGVHGPAIKAAIRCVISKEQS